MKLQLPTLKKPDGGEPEDSKASKFFADLYRDLSDRHLLLPLIGLLVAIVAVPMLLSSSTEPAPPPPAPAEPGDATALDAAVIVSDPGIRNYRDRLAALKSKNPFESDAGGTGSGGNQGSGASTASGSGDSSGSTDSSTAPTASTGSTSSPTPSGSVSADTGSDPGPPPATSPTDTPDTGGASTPGDVKPETRFYASRIDVTVGPVGKTKTIEGVKQLDFLPDRKTPVVAYLGLVDDNHALFSVNPGVAETQGEGDCAPQRNACMYVSLKVGKEQRFVYGDEDDAKVYRLKLLDARVVRVPDPRDREQGDGDGKLPRRATADASSRTK